MKFLPILVLAVLAGCSKPADDTRRILLYQSPMHPWVTSDKPGSCTICGMALVPVYEGGAGVEVGGLSLADVSLDALGVRTGVVEERELRETLRFSGFLEDDENIHRIVAAFYDGRVEEIFVEHVGQHVEKGAPLASLYSPELLYVVREYQRAVADRNDAVARNAGQRLIQFGLTVDQLRTLPKAADGNFAVKLLAPISGTVLTRNVYRGQYIKTGEPLFELGNLSRLWFHAEVYERDIGVIRLGQKAVITSASAPGRVFEGVVTFVDPNFDMVTRSTKVRIEVDNPLAEPGGLRRVLPHRASAEAHLDVVLGRALAVPRSAILRDGRREVAYVEVGPGRFEQRTVEVGRGTREFLEVLGGVKAGEKVVSEGNLLIDAEAQLRDGGAPAKAGTDNPSAFLAQMAAVSAALANDDAAGAVAAAGHLAHLVRDLPEAPGDLPELAGSDLRELRGRFFPWSSFAVAHAAKLRGEGGEPGVHVFECPMAGGAFDGAPDVVRWVQVSAQAANPFFGAAMRECGQEVKP
jgi:Cu(I)/Ag(I) efflux system membrane fusion protein